MKGSFVDHTAPKTDVAEKLGICSVIHYSPTRDFPLLGYWCGQMSISIDLANFT